ncbi:hypothetical protein PGTUg99_008336 [Puccinia graminis f. sp. tritici]|uniref:Uncharacterized protein n=1 Tax=Puccinia graminis f. sp. tritici TaxID=56615 RepID=A0A5B0RJX7_PUCGR|nr:hypothetical protein PGTUg99_008336 [Puccinia graminis f. sp. tritici]
MRCSPAEIRRPSTSPGSIRNDLAELHPTHQTTPRIPHVVRSVIQTHPTPTHALTRSPTLFSPSLISHSQHSCSSALRSLGSPERDSNWFFT